MAKMRLSRFEWTCVAIVVAAFALRVEFIRHPGPLWDSAWYLLLARSFAETGGFSVPWEPGVPYSGYWPPLYPVLVSPFVKLFGPSYSTLVGAASFFTLLLVLAVFFATRDMYGRTRAFAAAAVVAASPAWLQSDVKGMSESLLALLVALTLWTFLKSTKDPRWLLAAAPFAGLAYLTKATLGVPLVAAGVLALVGWRMWTLGPRAFLRRRLEVGLVVGGVAVLLALMFLRPQGVGGVGLNVIHPVREVVTQATFVPVLLAKLAFLGAFLLAVTLPFSMHVRAAWRERKDERVGAMWLATLVILFAAALFTAAFYHSEDRSLTDFDNVRYLSPAIVPFLWLVLPHWPFEKEAPRPADAQNVERRRRHEMWYALAVGSLALLLLLSPLAGAGSRARVIAFGFLALVPLAFAALAASSRVRLSTRRVARGEEAHRYEPAEGEDVGPIVGFGVAGVLLALVVSAWYAAVALAIAVALSTTSPRARVAAFVLLLLCSRAPGLQTPVPNEEAAATLDALLPPGALVALTEPAVYFAAVAPGDVHLRLIHAVDLENASAIVANTHAAQTEYENFTRAASWDYRFTFTPPLALRLAIEERLGVAPEIPSEPALSIHLRDALPLAATTETP